MNASGAAGQLLLGKLASLSDLSLSFANGKVDNTGEIGEDGGREFALEVVAEMDDEEAVFAVLNLASALICVALFLLVVGVS